ncbi:MAG TPA: HlyD family secretion protein, partial [Lysobacter sp.]|nr:HlyD family secretion protein [Lysobacter sp.]
PDGVLRPGLFGDVALTAASTAPVLTIPRSAVIDSGTRQVALVQIAEGRFEPRSVVLGRRSGDNVEVLDGLTEGERVVVSANFLIDAESNLQSALEGLDAGSAETPAPSTENAPPAAPAENTPPAAPADREPPAQRDAPPADAPPADGAVDHSQHGAH